MPETNRFLRGRCVAREAIPDMSCISATVDENLSHQLNKMKDTRFGFQVQKGLCGPLLRAFPPFLSTVLALVFDEERPQSIVPILSTRVSCSIQAFVL